MLAEMMGVEQITEDVVRGWVETYTLPTVKIGRRRVINLYRIRREQRYLSAVFSELIRLGAWVGKNPLANVRQIKTDQVELTVSAP